MFKRVRKWFSRNKLYVLYYVSNFVFLFLGILIGALAMLAMVYEKDNDDPYLEKLGFYNVQTLATDSRGNKIIYYELIDNDYGSFARLGLYTKNYGVMTTYGEMYDYVIQSGEYLDLYATFELPAILPVSVFTVGTLWLYSQTGSSVKSITIGITGVAEGVYYTDVNNQIVGEWLVNIEDVSLFPAMDYNEGLYKDAYDKGYNEGYNTGFNLGNEQGLLQGYNNGYQIGYQKGLTINPNNNFGAMITTVLLGVGTVLSIELLPNISIGAIIAVPIVFGVIAFVLGRKKE